MSAEGVPHPSTSTSSAEYLTYLVGESVQGRQVKSIRLAAVSSDLAPIWLSSEVRHASIATIIYPRKAFYLVHRLSKDFDEKKRLSEAGIPEYRMVELKYMRVVVLRNPPTGAYRRGQMLEHGEIRALALRWSRKNGQDVKVYTRP